MSLVNEGNGGNGMVMPVGPMASAYGGGYGGGYMGGDMMFFWIILFLFAMMNGGWGGFGFGGGAGMPYMMNNTTNNDIQRGFDQQSIMGGINGIQTGINGISTQLCNGFAGVNATVSNGFAQAEIAQNARQMANMNQLNAIAMNQQNFCCENRAGIADLKYTVATEACNDRQAVTNALFDVTTAQNNNTQQILNTINNGIQSIRDDICQEKIENLKAQNQNLQTQLNMATLRESQTAQNAFIQQGFSNEVDQLYNRLNSCPVPSTPVFGRTPIFTCNNNNGCVCGNGMM